MLKILNILFFILNICKIIDYALNTSLYSNHLRCWSGALGRGLWGFVQRRIVEEDVHHGSENQAAVVSTAV